MIKNRLKYMLHRKRKRRKRKRKRQRVRNRERERERERATERDEGEREGEREIGRGRERRSRRKKVGIEREKKRQGRIVTRVVGEWKESKRGCWLRVDKPRETRAPLRTTSTWRSVSAIPLFLRTLGLVERKEKSYWPFYNRFDPAFFFFRSDSEMKWFRGIDGYRGHVRACVCVCALSCFIVFYRAKAERILSIHLINQPVSLRTVFSDEDSICGSRRLSSRYRCILEDWTTSKCNCKFVESKPG